MNHGQYPFPPPDEEMRLANLVNLPKIHKPRNRVVSSDSVPSLWTPGGSVDLNISAPEPLDDEPPAPSSSSSVTVEMAAAPGPSEGRLVTTAQGFSRASGM